MNNSSDSLSTLHMTDDERRGKVCYPSLIVIRGHCLMLACNYRWRFLFLIRIRQIKLIILGEWMHVQAEAPGLVSQVHHRQYFTYQKVFLFTHSSSTSFMFSLTHSFIQFINVLIHPLFQVNIVKYLYHRPLIHPFIN